MNTLSYLSRQFDVLATSRSPSDDSQIKRANTWSTKSFLFPQTVSHPKRSLSSPPDFISLAAVTTTLKSSTQQVSTPASTSKSTLDSIIKRLFFIRLFVLVCRLFSAAWASVAARRTTTTSSPRPDSSRESDSDAKDDSDSELPPISIQSPALTTHSKFRSLDSRPAHTSILYLSHASHPDSSPTKPDPDPSPPHSISFPSSDSPSLQGTRTSTPISSRKPAFTLLPKTLVLDLDETLIHSTSRPIPSFPSTRSSGLLGLGSLGRRNKGAGHTVEVVMGGRSILYHVYKRPFVDFFLRTVSGWYTLVIFTASMQEYADPVIDWLDAGRGILSRRLFRDSCTLLPNGSYTKNLTVIEQDLSRVCLLDNSPISYRDYEANGIPIEGWTHDPSDEALLDLLPVLDSLRFTNDVRRVLGIRGFS